MIKFFRHIRQRKSLAPAMDAAVYTGLDATVHTGLKGGLLLMSIHGQLCLGSPFRVWEFEGNNPETS